MSRTWLMNMFGKELQDDEFYDIPKPRTEMALHVTMKTVQAGAVAGVGIVGPFLALAKEGEMQTLVSTARHAARYGKLGVLVGLIAGPSIAIARTRSMALEDVKYRCCKVRQSSYLRRVDGATVAGVISGSGAAVFARNSIATGAVFGLCLGLLTGEIYNSIAGDKSSSPHT